MCDQLSIVYLCLATPRDPHARLLTQGSKMLEWTSGTYAHHVVIGQSCPQSGSQPGRWLQETV